jgi:phosphatidylglycerophosphate synthase
MLDPLMRRLIDPPLNAVGSVVAKSGLPANYITLAGLGIGLLAVPLIAYGQFLPALAVILVNRLLDGIDGAVARANGATAFGGYLDIVCDMLFYAAVPLGFALVEPGNGPWAALLLASFIGTGGSFLGRAILAAQRGEPLDQVRGAKSFFHSAGLMEGTETILAFVLFCLFPDRFPMLAGIFAVLCLWTAFARVMAASE